MKWAPTFFVLLHSVFLDLKINFLEKPIYLLKLGKKCSVTVVLHVHNYLTDFSGKNGENVFLCFD